MFNTNILITCRCFFFYRYSCIDLFNDRIKFLFENEKTVPNTN